MGAEEFISYRSHKNRANAFRAAVAEAQHEYGHRGYTGSIAEKSGYTLIDTRPRPKIEAENEAQRLLDTDDPRIVDKWGPAGAIPVCPDPPGPILHSAKGREPWWEEQSPPSKPPIIGWIFFGWASSS